MCFTSTSESRERRRVKKPLTPSESLVSPSPASSAPQPPPLPLVAATYPYTDKGVVPFCWVVASLRREGMPSALTRASVCREETCAQMREAEFSL